MPSIRLICATDLTIPQLCVAEREIRDYTLSSFFHWHRLLLRTLKLRKSEFLAGLLRTF